MQICITLYDMIDYSMILLIAKLILIISFGICFVDYSKESMIWWFFFIYTNIDFEIQFDGLNVLSLEIRA